MNKSKENGITLISLIITVILLLILAGLAIDLAVDGKIFDAAEEIVNKSEKQLNDKEQMEEEVRNLYKKYKYYNYITF